MPTPSENAGFTIATIEVAMNHLIPASGPNFTFSWDAEPQQEAAPQSPPPRSERFRCAYCSRQRISSRCSQCSESGRQLCRYCCNTHADCQACAARVSIEAICIACYSCREGCCRCVLCEHCGRRWREQVESCETCGRCRHCDQCRHCYECDRVVSAASNDYCTVTERCIPCCLQQERHNLPYIHSHGVSFFKSRKTERKRNPSARLLGAEIEVDGYSDYVPIVRAVRNWRGAIVQDGSLSSVGIEINTSPASGDLWVDQIEEIASACEAGGGRINARCGLHVHIDGRDFSYYSIRRFVMLYAKVEPALFSIVHPRRRNNRYCHPCANRLTDGLWLAKTRFANKKKLLDNILGRADEPRRPYRDKYASHHKTGECIHYDAMNLNSWFLRGTFECRIHHGTINARNILSWGMLLAGLADTALRLTEKDILAMPHEGVELLKFCAPTIDVAEWVDSRVRFFRQPQYFAIGAGRSVSNLVRDDEYPDDDPDEVEEEDYRERRDGYTYEDVADDEDIGYDSDEGCNCVSCRWDRLE